MYKISLLTTHPWQCHFAFLLARYPLSDRWYGVASGADGSVCVRGVQRVWANLYLFTSSTSRWTLNCNSVRLKASSHQLHLKLPLSTTFAQICISVSPQLFSRPVLKTSPAKDALEGICLQAKTLTIGETCCSWLRAVRGFVLQTPYNTILKHTCHQMSHIKPSGLSQTDMELVTNVSAKISESGIYGYSCSSALYTGRWVVVSD